MFANRLKKAVVRKDVAVLTDGTGNALEGVISTIFGIIGKGRRKNGLTDRKV
ncbi:hypothetical protein FACS1894130_11470 [Spirochaetia bacterium]|nr:hypothetical protein FACS1894130_11470 [Spirochaetia bacterium]